MPILEIGTIIGTVYYSNLGEFAKYLEAVVKILQDQLAPPSHIADFFRAFSFGVSSLLLTICLESFLAIVWAVGNLVFLLRATSVFGGARRVFGAKQHVLWSAKGKAVK